MEGSKSFLLMCKSWYLNFEQTEPSVTEKLLAGVMRMHCKVLERSGPSAVACADNVSILTYLQIPKSNMDQAFPLSVWWQDVIKIKNC